MQKKKMDKWDRRFMRIACEVASWSKDPKRQVGSVLVDQNKRIISTGYNGLPTQLDSIRIVPNSLKNALTIHSEINTLANIRKELDTPSLGPGYHLHNLPARSEHCADMLIANLNLVRVVALAHTASQSKWKESMANAVAHLWRIILYTTNSALRSLIMPSPFDGPAETY